MMKSTRTLQKAALLSLLQAGLVFGAMGLSTAGMVAPLAAQARGPVQRVVHGKVETKAGAGIKGAVVYLLDTHTQSVKSAITEDDGSYRFVQLSQNTDYTLYAKNNGAQSKNKTISSFDSKNDFDITLTIDK